MMLWMATPLVAAEFPVYVTIAENQAELAGKMTLIDSASVAKIIKQHHYSQSFALHRDGLSAGQRSEAVASAKKQLLINDKKLKELMDDPKKDDRTHFRSPPSPTPMKWWSASSARWAARKKSSG